MASCTTPHTHALAWTCPLRCGQMYKRSSGRSIRRHVMACFRVHHRSTTGTLSDVEVSNVINELQESGQLTTGLRRWKERQPRRSAHELGPEDRWDCIWDCGKSYRSTSSRSILHHANTCMLRSSYHGGEMDAQTVRAITKQETTGAVDVESDQNSVSTSWSSCSSLPSLPASPTCSLKTEQPVDRDACTLPSPPPRYLASDTPRTLSGCTFTELSPPSHPGDWTTPARVSNSRAVTPAPYDGSASSALLADIVRNLSRLDPLFMWVSQLSTYPPLSSPPPVHAPLQLDQYIAALSYFLQSPMFPMQ